MRTDRRPLKPDRTACARRPSRQCGGRCGRARRWIGANMTRRLMQAGHQCVVFDVNPQNVRQLTDEGAIGATTVAEFVRKLDKPRIAWLMVPAGEPTEQAVMDVADGMEAGDIIID